MKSETAKTNLNAKLRYVKKDIMSETIQAYYFYDSGLESNQRRAFDVDKIPDICPLCQKGINPIQHIVVRKEERLEAVFQCPIAECKRLFISYYKPHWVGGKYSKGVFFLGSAPYNILPKDFSEEIKKMSPQFCEIYNQAKEADERKLGKICGAGYRKALEFLIKDYLISLRKDERDVIAKKRLGDCINEYIPDARLKHCAKRAAWLGNDETHFIKKWEEKDLSDLKNLIGLTLHWLESEMLTEQIIGEMPEKKKS